jgi:hypothetical protein
MDEIEALSAIYPDEWKTEDEAFRTFSATITESGRVATLLITLPAGIISINFIYKCSNTNRD